LRLGAEKEKMRLTESWAHNGIEVIAQVMEMFEAAISA